MLQEMLQEHRTSMLISGAMCIQIHALRAYILDSVLLQHIIHTEGASSPEHYFWANSYAHLTLHCYHYPGQLLL